MIHYSASTKSFYPSELYSEDTLPTDAVEISIDEYKSLLIEQTQGEGQMIIPSESGYPIIGVTPTVSGVDLIKRQILALEVQQTPRRMREAVLGTDNGWLAGIGFQIEILRAQLGAL